MPTRQQAIIRTNDGLVYWCIYASLCLNELNSHLYSYSVTAKMSSTQCILDHVITALDCIPTNPLTFEILPACPILLNDYQRKYFLHVQIQWPAIIEDLVQSGAIIMQFNIWCYPMLRADSRFWLVNNREIWSRISRLTSSAWDIKTKERPLMTS